MVLVVKDRIKDTSSTSGSGTITLDNSPPAGYQAFSTLGNGSTTYYAIQGSDDSFEIGLGTYNANTLTRTTILSSSNNGVIINLPSGSHTVWVDYPAAKAYLSEEGIDRSFTSTAGIAAGRPVILNSAGTVTQVGTTTIAAGLGTLSSTTVTNAEDNTVAMGETNQFVNVYRIANATNIYLTPNTISSTDLKTITKGTTVSFDAGYERICGIIYEPNQGKYVAISMDSNNYVTGTAVTFNGTGSSATLTLGTRTVLDSSAYGGTVANSQIAYDTTAQKIVLSYYAGNPFTLVVNLSGTSLTSGSRTAVPIAATYINSSSMKCAYSSTENRIIYLYATNEYGQPNDKKLYTTVGTVSGTSISFGATAIVSNQPTPYQNNAKDAEVGVDNNGVVVLSYLSSGLVLQSQAGTLSNTTITWGSPSQVSNITCLEANNTLGESSIRPISNGKMIVTRATKSDSPSNASQGIFCIITVSGTTVNNGSVQTFSSSATDFPNASTNTSQTQAVINFGYGSFNNIIFQESSQDGESNLTTSNYLGVASTSAGANASVNINIPGSINNDQTGLTIGRNYYTSSAGVISTTLSPNFVGRAISSTQLLLEEEKGNSLDGFSNGAITKGKPVVMQADGDVAQAAIVSQSTTNTGTASQGSLGSMGTYSTDMFSMAVAKDGLTYCFTYQNTSTQQACKIGTRSGNSISWGSELVLASANSDSHYVSYNEEADVFLTTYNIGDLIKGTAVSYSGNTGTKGSEVTIMNTGGSSGGSHHYQHWYDSYNKVTVCWAKGGVSGNDTNRSSAVVITLTGTSIALGTLYENASAGGQYSKGCDVTGGKHVLYWRSNSSYYPMLMTMTVTGSGAISWGTAYTINSATGSRANPIYNPNYPNKIIVAGQIVGNTFSYGGFNISGTAISNSTFYTGGINNANSYIESGGNMGVYSNYSGNYCFVYQTSGSNYYSKYNFATTTNGVTLTVATAVQTNSHGDNQFYAGACASDVDGTVVENHNNRSSSPGTYAYYCFNPTFSFTVTTSTPNLTATNYLGIASDTVANNENATIQTQGAVNPDQSSLTAGQLYYVQTDGTLSTTAGSPSVIAGIATSATTLLVTKS